MPWYDGDYASRRSLIILNRDSLSLPDGYPVRIHFDSTTTPTSNDLYAESRSSAEGDDFRVVHQGTAELPRYVQSFSPDRIDIWFNTQDDFDPHPDSDDENYHLYYGNPAASSPPGDAASVLYSATDANTVGLWRLDEGTGATVGDASGRGHHGSATDMGRIEGKFGLAGAFNGTSSMVNLGDANAFNLNAFTTEAWVYLNQVSGERTVFVKRAADNSLIYDAQTDYSEIWLRLNGNSCNVRSNQTLEPNRWYHFAWTYDGSTARVYVNGTLMNSAACGQALRTGNTPLWLGGDGTQRDKWINAYIQHARLSNFARTTFDYGKFGLIVDEPELTSGAAESVLVTGTQNLVVLSLAGYPSESGGLILQAVVENTGNLATGNGFYTDLHIDHQPSGAGDLQGSVRYWVNDPVGPGEALTVTTILTRLLGPTRALGGLAAGPAEYSGTAYLQADSTGVVSETSDVDNISPGTAICIAQTDAYEDDDDHTGAVPIEPYVPQVHNFDSLGDEDWIRFDAEAGTTYVVTTGALGPNADTYLHLYDEDGKTLLQANDDHGGELTSRIAWTARRTGARFVKVSQWNPNAAGCGTDYTVTLLSMPPRLSLPLVYR